MSVQPVRPSTKLWYMAVVTLNGWQPPASWGSWFDWLYQHHLALIGVGAVGLALSAWMAVDTVRNAPRPWTWWWSIPGLVIVLLVVAAWILGDAGSPARDVDRRVAEVVGTLPAGAHRIHHRSSPGEAVYDVPGSPAAVEAHIRRVAQATFGPHELFGPGRDDAPNSINFGFGGRGCVSSVELSVDIVATHGASRVTVGASCSD
ncbi:MAG TPA: hypothetical protein VGM93_07165 [Acidimicrobiales bacterium]